MELMPWCRQLVPEPEDKAARERGGGGVKVQAKDSREADCIAGRWGRLLTTTMEAGESQARAKAI